MYTQAASKRPISGESMATQILIVDDEVNVTQLFSMMLEMEGYEAIVAHDVKGAIESIRLRPPQLILLDIMMPEESGLELCRYIRAHPELASIPVVIISAKTQLEEVQEGLGAGADSYLLKPISKKELIEAVQSALS